MEHLIRIARDRHVLTLTLDDPKTKNALSAAMVGKLRAVLADAREDRTIRAIVLRGANGVFCAGADLKGTLALLDADAGEGAGDPVYRMNMEGGAFFAELDQQPQTVIAVVEGPALGGGLGLVCCADVVLATPAARFAMTEVTLGIPPAQIAPFVVARLGLAKARRLALTATRLDGAQALDIGLVDAMFEAGDALETGLSAVLSDIGRCAPEALAATKALLRLNAGHDPTAMSEHAARVFTDCLRSAEGREGISAFTQRRKPSWAESAE